MRRLLLIVLLLIVTVTGCSAAAAPAQDIATLADTVDAATVRALQQQGDVVLLDVREPHEYDAGHIPGVKLIPMGQVPGRLGEIPKDRTVILTCRSGNRSGQIADYLRQQGYANVHNMRGGILAWQAAGYPVEK